jgi:hypothetical protein
MQLAPDVGEGDGDGDDVGDGNGEGEGEPETNGLRAAYGLPPAHAATTAAANIATTAPTINRLPGPHVVTIDYPPANDSKKFAPAATTGRYVAPGAVVHPMRGR